MLPRVAERNIALVQAETPVALEAFQRQRQAFRIIVAEENRSTLPELAE